MSKRKKRPRTARNTRTVTTRFIDKAMKNELILDRTAADVRADEQAAAEDSCYFATHPGATRYQRPPFIGELRILTPFGHDLWYVIVHQLKPGVRIRVPIFRPITEALH